ncbi:MAG: ATP-binding cassette domain-containing protein [Acidobacteriales bacterium]|nr:ATP-binding cassette domain-containing protein [Terriglobales bacterium]
MAAVGVEFAKVSYALPPADGQPGRVLLRDISLQLEAGTVTALLGRSGSGKTTLLRMVNGLVMPTSGEVRVGDKATGEFDTVSLRRSIGYVIQETGLFPHMTVERNVGMALELAGRSRGQIASRTAKTLALVGLGFTEFRGRYPWQLSGGQRQRVGLARALAMTPEILLMDEPFGALDPLTRAEMQTMLRDLLQKVDKTVLLVTHDLDEALYLAERVVFLAEGSVVADLPASEVLKSENHHVKDYVSAVHRAVSI